MNNARLECSTYIPGVRMTWGNDAVGVDVESVR